MGYLALVKNSSIVRGLLWKIRTEWHKMVGQYFKEITDVIFQDKCILMQTSISIRLEHEELGLI